MLDYHLERKITDRVTVVRLLSQYQQLTHSSGLSANIVFL
ncbi:transcriptional regulator [Streptococcus dysgalactiae subsp. equisimilis]|nr:transcriptional regulator [Streptococcus dysgalactiae subsp. equisimilis]